jgi:hypothetical protein
LEPDEYCRQIEAYLCQRNEGHLVRVAGPAFEKVREWANLGIPLKVVLRGIDRHVERASTHGPRRRPVRVEFCEADVLDAFDQWRRAVGLRLAPAEDAGATILEDRPAKSRRSLPAHIDRVIARLTAVRAGTTLPAAWDLSVEQAVRDLDVVRGHAERLRGPARDAVIGELAAIDARLLAASRDQAAPSLLTEVDLDARAELHPFAGRLSEAAFADALAACRDRLLREALGLPMIQFG